MEPEQNAHCTYSAGALANIETLLFEAKAEGINNKHSFLDCSGAANVPLLSTALNNFKSSECLSHPSL